MHYTTHSLTHSATHPFNHLPTHPLTQPPTGPTRSLPPSFTHSLTHSHSLAFCQPSHFVKPPLWSVNQTNTWPTNSVSKPMLVGWPPSSRDKCLIFTCKEYIIACMWLIMKGRLYWQMKKIKFLYAKLLCVIMIKIF